MKVYLSKSASHTSYFEVAMSEGMKWGTSAVMGPATFTASSARPMNDVTCPMVMEVLPEDPSVKRFARKVLKGEAP